MIATKSQSKIPIKRSSVDSVMLSSHLVNKFEIHHRRSSLSSTVSVSSATSSFSDDGIQSTCSRRRYMRRGSRAPTMLLVCVRDIIDSTTTASIDIDGSRTDHDAYNIQPPLYHRRPSAPERASRRVSLTAGLYQQLGELSITCNNSSCRTSFSSLEDSELNCTGLVNFEN